MIEAIFVKNWLDKCKMKLDVQIFLTQWPLCRKLCDLDGECCCW